SAIQPSLYLLRETFPPAGAAGCAFLAKRTIGRQAPNASIRSLHPAAPAKRGKGQGVRPAAVPSSSPNTSASRPRAEVGAPAQSRFPLVTSCKGVLRPKARSLQAR